MRAILEFELPEDNNEFRLANKALSFYCSIWDLKTYLREQLKYNHDLTEDQDKVFESVQEKLLEILESNNVDLDEFE
jgi:hypothetical protein